MSGQRPVSFDVLGPLPTGTTVLEASAGTGKTFTIAALATRYVAEGFAELPRLMLVTFGRDATQELRERVRERLVCAERGLAEPAAARASPDRVLAALAAVPDAQVAARRARLAAALAQFDAATIATTHQFCQRMLDGLGVAGDADPDAVFVEHVDDLVEQVVDDFYVRKYGVAGAGRPAFTRDEALVLARAAVRDPQARLEPSTGDPASTAGVRHRFAAAVREEVERRKRARRLYTYDDMLSRLGAVLAGAGGSDAGRRARQRLRERYAVVLVDEFQDTDPIQWQILRDAFHGHTHLVIVGDPKQAIYAFRGADIVSYLDATEAAGRHATLDRNHRSDGVLLDALGSVLGGAALGDARIVAHPVTAAHPGTRLAGAGPPLRLRVLPRGDLPVARNGRLLVPGARDAVAADLAADVAGLLAAGARLHGRWGGRVLAPGDVAVLVRTNDQGRAVRDALAAAAVPAVLSGTASVFGTPAAAEWLVLLEACEQPRAARVRAAALTVFGGVTADELCGADGDTAAERVATALRGWAAVLHERGVAALLEAVTTGTGLPRRLLARTDGERLLTDLRHVGQALHAATVERHLGPAALVDWLRHRIAEAADDTVVERSRRLESDVAAVQVITIHRSKGLEFPVVYLPFGWDRNVRDPDVALLHDDAGRRVLDVGGPDGGDWKEHCGRHRVEEAGEDLRLLYVALTRACCQVVTWWAPGTTTATSPLHRLLFARPVPGTAVPASVPVPGTDAAALAALRAVPAVAVETVTPRAPAPFTGTAAPPGRLAVAVFGRRLDETWRRTSYSALTAGTHGQAGATSEPEQVGVDDEALPDPDLPGPDPAGPRPDVPGADLPSPMAALPVGTGFGTLVHAVLETADWTAPDLAAELATHAREHLGRHPVAGLDAATLAGALVPALETPLGPLAGGLRLRDVAPRDRLAELDFEMPLAGGDTPRAGPAPTLGALVPLLRRHLPAGDPLAGYPDVLAGLADQPLRGYLTGSIDGVLRLPGPVFTVVDHKTNWLGPIDPAAPVPLTAAHYAPPRLAEAMITAHYPLQALVYAVALHRYLRWRLPGYEPGRHLGGVLYLFLRGMCGPGTPVAGEPGAAPHGVFAWRPPAALVVELSELLAGTGVSP
ncbi:MAG TPA: UvrD-helicase domain-containing protein [Pseudonocardia sp.]|nr:UvrD-helicase domain-containing protein [Pseudonocardia sp.]